MKGKHGHGRPLGNASPQLRLMLLALLFFLGALLGQVLANRISPAVSRELERYLSDYYQLKSVPDPFGSVLLLYFRYPAMAVLLGFASVGWLLLPCLTVACGCCLSFSVCCYTAAFGSAGWLVALAALGPRCLVMLPCYFWLAADSWQSSASLAGLLLGRQGAVHQEPRRLLRWAILSAVLLAGVFVEWKIGPRLLHLALGRLLS